MQLKVIAIAALMGVVTLANPITDNREDLQVRLVDEGESLRFLLENIPGVFGQGSSAKEECQCSWSTCDGRCPKEYMEIRSEPCVNSTTPKPALKVFCCKFNFD